jgi:threonine/homoserine/homoserine lactone efflux protein
MQIIFLGLLFAVLGLVTDGCFALVAGTASHWMKDSRRFLRLERYVGGALFISLGLAAAFAGNEKK